jgi:phosphoribosylamine-glycine ligase
MKFMLISDCGNALGAAIRLKTEGNQVAMWVKSSSADSVGKNLVDSIHDWKLTPDFDTVWVFDTTNHGHFADALRLSGYPVIGSSLFEDRLEMDREFARSMMKRAGIPVPKSTFFDCWKDGIEFVKAHKGQRFAIKPSDHLSGNLPSHVADQEHPTEDLLGTLDHYKRTFAGDPEYEMQEFVPGIDLSSAGWFNSEDYLKPCYHTREVKATMDGDRGATGGCAGNVMYPSDDWIMEQTVYKFEDILRDEHIPLLIDINCIVDPERRQLLALEWTPRWGFDSEPAIFAVGLDEELGRFLSDMAHGSATPFFPMKAGFTAGVRVTIPPYPADDTKAPAGLPILGVSDKDLDDWFYAYDVMKTSDGHLVSAGNYGLIGVACAHDVDPAEAIEAATERARQVKVSEAQFRLDLADVFMPDLEALDASEVSAVKSRSQKGEYPRRAAQPSIQRLFRGRAAAR